MFLYYIPFLLIIPGLSFLIFPPKKINYIYGYKTKRSMRNMETWKEAHLYSGKLLSVFGILFLILTYILPFMYSQNTTIMVTLLGFLFTMIITMVLTEIRLHKIIKKGNNEDT